MCSKSSQYKPFTSLPVICQGGSERWKNFTSHQCYNSQMNEDGMGRACSIRGGYEKYV